MSAAKEPIDLRAAVQARLDQIAFLAPLRLEDVPRRACSALDEGTSADYSQGVRLNDSVAIFLNWWGWARPHKRYSFAVFEQVGGRWSQVASRIEDIDEAVTLAVSALTEQALLSSRNKP